MKVPFFDPRPQHEPLAAQLQQALASFLDNPRFILGEHVERFEAAACEQLQVRHAIGVSSGTDALLCSLLALGIGEGAEVITTPFTFAATAEVIVRAGAVPRFVDIDPVSYNLDVSAVEAAITTRTRAVIPVHLFGDPVEMDPLLTLAAQRGLAVIEDAAQAWGGQYRNRNLGSLGTLGCFSFFPSKPLGGWGDGGLIVTHDDALAERCRALRGHGKDRDGQWRQLGGNFRLDALQAAVLGVKLPQVASWQAHRAQIAARYALGLGRIEQLQLPTYAEHVLPAHSVYTVRVRSDGRDSNRGRRRDRVRAALLDRGVATALYYANPLHREPVLLCGERPPALPNAELAADEVLSLPIFPGISQAQHDWVIQSVGEICAETW